MYSPPAPSLPPSPDLLLHALRDLAHQDTVHQDYDSLHIRAGALFARLKALNRAANAATRSHKQTTADARTEMDQTHLGLQNLLYEKRHLEREIDKCRHFACAPPPSHRLSLRLTCNHSSVYQDIPMYSVEQFMELAPPEARTEEVMSNDHQLMLNRLGFELVERQRCV